MQSGWLAYSLVDSQEIKWNYDVVLLLQRVNFIGVHQEDRESVPECRL